MLLLLYRDPKNAFRISRMTGARVMVECDKQARGDGSHRTYIHTILYSVLPSGIARWPVL